MNPSVTQKERILSLDMVRGLALFGILFINVGAYQIMVEGMQAPDYSGLNGVVASLIGVVHFLFLGARSCSGVFHPDRDRLDPCVCHPNRV